MKAYTCDSGLLKELCKTKKCWGMMISGHDPYRMVKDARYLNLGNDDYLNIVLQQWGILLFKTRKALDLYYKMTRGDDTGGTVYALTCDPRGKLMNENT